MKDRRTLILLLAAVISGLLAFRGIQKEAFTFWTGLFFFLSLMFLLMLLMNWCFHLLGTSSEKRSKLRTSFFTTAIVLFLIELALRQFGIYSTHGERNGVARYVPEYKFENRDSWYYTYSPNSKINYQKTEFDHVREINSLGIPEKEIPFAKEEGEFRILALGDSFTEGDGASYEDTWIKKVEVALVNKIGDRKITTINAGVGGNDVVYEYRMLLDKLDDYQPDAIIVCVNNSDLDDLQIRGGDDRFQADGTVRIMEPISWEWLYGISYTVRLAIHASGYSLRLNREKLSPEQARILIKEKVLQMKAFADAAQAEFLTVVHPTMVDLEKDSYHDPQMDSLVHSLAHAKIPFLDLRPRFFALGYGQERSLHEIYWPVNHHFNPKGYQLFSEYVVEKIDTLQWFESVEE